jgi:p-methyltransferase
MKKGSVSRFVPQWNYLASDEGIVTCGSFLIGFPGETDDTVEQTQEFIERSGLQYYFIQPFYYLHHTPVHKNAEKYGLTGNGLLWSHDTMEAPAATAHVNRLFREIEGAIWVNPDYTLWEIAYLRSVAHLEQINDYRRSVNARTVAQMERYGLA